MLSVAGAESGTLGYGVQLPGVGGFVDLDPAAATGVAAGSNSQIGTNRVFVPVPTNPGLVGFDVFFQLAGMPQNSAAAGPWLNNAVAETVGI